MAIPLKVLIVEDAEDDVFFLVRELQQAGYDVTHRAVATAAEMAEAMDSSSWDLVVSDYTMPNFSGVEALSLLRQRDADIPFIFLSGTLGEERAVDAMRAGANDYLTKGNILRLMPAIERELREKENRLERKKVEIKLSESEERFHQVFERASMGMAIVGIDGRILQVNPAFCKMLGVQRDAFIRAEISSWIYPDDRPQLLQLLKEIIKQHTESTQLDLRFIHHEQKNIWLSLTISLMVNANNIPLYFIFQAQDITLYREAEQKLQYLAQYDALTGALNKELLKEGISKAILLAKQKGKMVAVLTIDLDRFKLLNDTLGSEACDLILKQVFERIKINIKEADILARGTGDTFILVLPEVVVVEEAVDAAKNILQCIDPPFQVHGGELFVTASVGISLFPQDGLDAESLIKNADLAIYTTKARGGHTYQLSSPGVLKAADKELKLSNALRHALRDNEFILHYQPKINLKTGRIAGFEALIRWQQKDGTLIFPSDFINLAEETAQIVPMGYWVLRKACEQIVQWKKEYSEPLVVAINLSFRQILEENIVAEILKIFAETGVDPYCIEFEITESMMVHTIENKIQAIQTLKEKGVQFSIDDFGTGYSSFGHLKRFVVDSLKIDQTFIKNLYKESSNEAIVSAIIAMARSLGIKIIAEGVETREQLDFLKQHDCDLVQGFYFSKAVDAASIGKLLKTGIQPH